MIPRSDASLSSPPGFPAEGDRDMLAINGRHFDLGPEPTIPSDPL